MPKWQWAVRKRLELLANAKLVANAERNLASERESASSAGPMAILAEIPI
jgi:hypothetical protein